MVLSTWILLWGPPVAFPRTQHAHHDRYGKWSTLCSSISACVGMPGSGAILLGSHSSSALDTWSPSSGTCPSLICVTSLPGSSPSSSSPASSLTLSSVGGNPLIWTLPLGRSFSVRTSGLIGSRSNCCPAWQKAEAWAYISDCATLTVLRITRLAS